ncbi:hypothetical protein AB0F46_29580 [Streptomyces sp. NPDC026665]|uniref:hypothetical protein n=1 Tax=Streptomyces sp. NPDC026665 TaxID=3154798 RepID=UPI0033FB36C9
MTVIAGQPIALLAQWYEFEGGPIVDLDATPTIGITRVAGGAVILAPTTTGVSHPGTGSYGYGWTPATDLAPGLYLALWSGSKSGSPVTATESITVTAPTTGRVYATVPEYEAYPGGTSPAPSTTGTRLGQASRMLERLVLRYCMYDVDTASGMPTHPLVIAALRDAVCAQVAWWEEVGDPSGADAVGWGSISIGSVSLGRSVTAVSGEDAPARQLAPAAWDALLDPGLTADIFRMGAVTSQ